MRAVLFDAVGTLIRPWPAVGAVYARAAAAHRLRCPARALEAAFHPAYRELFPERFFGRPALYKIALDIALLSSAEAVIADPEQGRWTQLSTNLGWTP